MIMQPAPSILPTPEITDTDRSSVRVPLSLSMATLLSSLVFVAPPPFFPAMASELGVSVPVMGQVMTTMLFTGGALSLVVGPLADRYGMRRLMLIGAAAAVTSMLSFGLAPTYLTLILTALLGGFANATLPGLSLAVARNTLAGAARRRAIGWATAGGAGAAIIGVPLLAIVSDLAGWRVAFIFAGLTAGGTFIFLATSLPCDAVRPASPASPKLLIAAYAPLLSHLPTLRLYGLTILRSTTWAGMIGYFGAFLGNELELGSAWIGVAYMLGGGGYLIGSLAAGRTLERLSPRLVIGVSNIDVAIALFGMFVLSRNPVVAVALLIVASVGGALCFVGTVTLLQAESAAGAGTTMALNGALMNLGSAGGGAIGGVMLAMGGYQALGLGLPLFAILALFLVAARSAPASANSVASA